ncbi:CBS domain-containing protein [Noviherbaspirillum agri]
MSIRECCNIGVVCCNADTSLQDVAALMRKHHVGDVVVVEEKGDNRIPVGIVTDRDIVMETVSVQMDAAVFTAGDIMTTPLITVREDQEFVETLRLMRHHKIRRMPVVAQDGYLCGIVTADDIITLLSMELSLMTAAIIDQPMKEGKLRKEWRAD